jgi:Spy/CpxP family protein refolding chaperone
MKRTISILTIALLIAGAGFAQENVKTEQVGHKEKKVMKHNPILRLESLTEAQRANLEKMQNQNREVSKPQREKLRRVKQELRTKQTSASPNMDEVNSLIDDKNTLEAQVEKNRAAQGFKMRAVLTPEQKTELDSKMKAQKAERKQMRGERKEMKPQKEAH